MTLVRCPACSSTVTDPAPLYRCAACARRLRWHPAGPSPGPLQLGLFGEAVPARSAPSGRRRPRPTPREALDPGGRSQSRVRSQQDALAATAELFYDEEGFTVEAIARARALLTGQSTADLR